MNATANEVLGAAIAHINAGQSIIPLTPLDKLPHFELLPKLPPKDDANGEMKARWYPYQSRLPDESEVIQWDEKGMKCFALVCGQVSGGLVTLDFDVARFYDAWRERTGTDSQGLCVQRSGRDGGGYHVRFKVPGKFYPSDKLAYTPDESNKAGRTVAIEMKGEGSYAVSAPSVHRSGRAYEVIEGDLHDIPVISHERAERLIQAARELEEAPLNRQQIEQAARQPSARPVISYQGDSVIHAFNAKNPIDEVLRRYGYTETGGRWAAPNGHRGLVVIFEDRFAFSHNSDDLICDGHRHDSFSVFAKYEHGGDLKAAAKAAAKELGMERKTPEPDLSVFIKTDAEPTDDELPCDNFEPFPLEHLPPFLYDYCEAVARSKSSPIDFVVTYALAALASAIGVNRKIQLKDGWVEPSIMWTMVVADSGSVKTPCMKAVMKVHDRLTKRAYEKYAKDREQYELDLENYGLQKLRRTVGLNAANKPKEPETEQYVVDDTTIEALSEVLAANARGVLLANDELSGWFKSFNQYKKGGGSDESNWLKMFSGVAINVNRKGSAGSKKHIYVPEPYLSITGGIQPAVLKEVLTQQRQADGMAARFLYTYPPPMPNYWTEYSVPEDVTQKYEEIVEGLFDLEPVTYMIDAEGVEVWKEFHDEIATVKGYFKSDLLKAVWGKAQSYAARLALILHTITYPDAPVVTTQALISGIAIAKYYCREAARIFTNAGGHKVAKMQAGTVERIKKEATIETLVEYLSQEPLTKGRLKNKKIFRDMPVDAFDGLIETAISLGVIVRTGATFSLAQP